jgi:CDP-diacylglycerol pyrophosphatase
MAKCRSTICVRQKPNVGICAQGEAMPALGQRDVCWQALATGIAGRSYLALNAGAAECGASQAFKRVACAVNRRRERRGSFGTIGERLKRQRMVLKRVVTEASDRPGW